MRGKCSRAYAALWLKYDNTDNRLCPASLHRLRVPLRSFALESRIDGILSIGGSGVLTCFFWFPSDSGMVGYSDDEWKKLAVTQSEPATTFTAGTLEV